MAANPQAAPKIPTMQLAATGRRFGLSRVCGMRVSGVFCFLVSGFLRFRASGVKRLGLQVGATELLTSKLWFGGTRKLYD